MIKLFIFLLLFSCVNTFSSQDKFVSMSEFDPSIIVEARYFSEHNFLGRKISGYTSNSCWLTKEAARALKKAQAEFLKNGYSLKFYDCYRPQKAVDDFVSWSQNLQDQVMKAEFYPFIDKSTLFDQGYIAKKSGHSRGSTVDLTLVQLPIKSFQKYSHGSPIISCIADFKKRIYDNSIDMGTGYDCFHELSHTQSLDISSSAQNNRKMLVEIMSKYGFKNYSKEWWHFTLINEPYPDQYFNFDV
jgi:D-alanyl-D-alanine dipeptidase